MIAICRGLGIVQSAVRYLLEIFVSGFRSEETAVAADLRQQVVLQNCPSSWPTAFF